MDKTEFENSILTLSPKLRKHAFFLTKNDDDADDLVQDVSLRALLYYPKITDFSNINGWLFTILTNTFINKYRKSKKENTLVDKTPDMYHINQCDDKGDISPYSAYQEKELKQLIESLPPVFREPFKMHVEGFKYEEISKKLRTKIGTIKSRIFWARKQLRKSINTEKLDNMEAESFGYDEIILFKKIVPVLLQSGWTRKKVEKTVDISEPTVTKILRLEPHLYQLQGSSIDKIRRFNETYNGFIKEDTFKPKPIERTPENTEAIDVAEKLCEHPYFKGNRNEEQPIEKQPIPKGKDFALIDSLSGEELFWYHLGKAFCHKPGNVKVTIITE